MESVLWVWDSTAYNLLYGSNYITELKRDGDMLEVVFELGGTGRLKPEDVEIERCEIAATGEMHGIKQCGSYGRNAALSLMTE